MLTVTRRIFASRGELRFTMMMRMLIAHWLMKAASKVCWDMFEAISVAVAQNAMADPLKFVPCDDPECEACVHLPNETRH